MICVSINLTQSRGKIYAQVVTSPSTLMRHGAFKEFRQLNLESVKYDIFFQEVNNELLSFTAECKTLFTIQVTPLKLTFQRYLSKYAW